VVGSQAKARGRDNLRVTGAERAPDPDPGSRGDNVTTELVHSPSDAEMTIAEADPLVGTLLLEERVATIVGEEVGPRAGKRFGPRTEAAVGRDLKELPLDGTGLRDCAGTSNKEAADTVIDVGSFTLANRTGECTPAFSRLTPVVRISTDGVETAKDLKPKRALPSEAVRRLRVRMVGAPTGEDITKECRSTRVTKPLSPGQEEHLR
jgi:hypothetical protein